MTGRALNVSVEGTHIDADSDSARPSRSARPIGQPCPITLDGDGLGGCHPTPGRGTHISLARSRVEQREIRHYVHRRVLDIDRARLDYWSWARPESSKALRIASACSEL